MPNGRDTPNHRHGPDSEVSSGIERAFLMNSDIARRFGAEIDVTAPAPDDGGFFLVKRRGSADPEQFRSWLLGRIGGRNQVLLESRNGIFVVWMRFGTAQEIRDEPSVALVGGVSVDLERLQQTLSPDL